METKETDIQMDHENAVVRVRDLKKHFPIHEGILQKKTGDVKAVDGVSFSIPKGETFGLVGESGSGKTTVGKSILRIEEPTSGLVEISGEKVTDMSPSQLKQFRKNMQMVFQDPSSSLNPRKQIKDIISSPLDVHNIGSRDEKMNRVQELLDTVGLPQQFMYRRPSQLSGGQKQRVGIARALALNPEFIVFDEPTSALDVSVQAQVISLINNIQEEYDLTFLFISHDLSLIKSVSDWIGIMYLGKLVEIGKTHRVFNNPQHPYTLALLSAIPTISSGDEKQKPERIRLDGEIPDPRNEPSGCSFRTRCPKEFDKCSHIEPTFYEIDDNHYSRCLLHE